MIQITWLVQYIVASKKVPGIGWYNLQEFARIITTAKREKCIDTLLRFREAVRRKHPEKWGTNNWFLLHDNAPAHRPVLDKDLLKRAT